MSKTSTLGISAGLIAVVLGVFATVLALPSKAATDYPFLIRAYVESVNTTNGTILARGISSSTAAIADTQSKNVTYSAKSADFYRWEQNKTVKVPRNINYVKVGQEIVLKGNKTGGSFIADVVTINDRTFDVVGRVTDYNTSEDWIEVLVGRSTLSHASVVNTKIKFHYNSDTDCLRLGSEIGCSEIDIHEQGSGRGIKVRGERSGPGGQWDITNAWNNYPL